MRLREVQWILRAAMKELAPEGVNRRQAGNRNLVTMVNVGRLRARLEQVGQLEIFHDAVVQILASTPFRGPYDPVDLEDGDFNQLTAAVAKLRYSAKDLLGLIDQLLADEVPNSFAYTLPRFRDGSFESVREQFDRAESIFAETLSRLLGVRVRVGAFESGSNVVEFVLESARQVPTPAAAVVGVAAAASAAVTAAKPALDLIARIYAGAKDLVTFLQACAVKQEELRKLKLGNDVIELQNRLAEAETEARIVAISREITEATKADLVPNQENPHLLVQRSVKMLSEELERGARLQFPSNVPESVTEAVASCGAGELLAPAPALRPVAEDEPIALLDPPEKE